MIGREEKEGFPGESTPAPCSDKEASIKDLTQDTHQGNPAVCSVFGV